MKKQTLLTITLLLMGLALHATDFAPVGATWYYSQNYFDVLPEPVEGYNKLESVKDTLYHGKMCRKIIKKDRLLCSDRPEVEYVYTSNDSVFQYDPVLEDFQLLYNFNAEKGEYWEILTSIDGIQVEIFDTLRITVDSMDFMQINGEELKRLYVTYHRILDGKPHPDIYAYKSQIIERIGDLNYMFNYIPLWAEVCDANFMNGLRCYEDEVLGEYKTGIASSCGDEIYLQFPTIVDKGCVSANPHEIDTTFFWYRNDTLFIRDISNRFCGDVFGNYYKKMNTYHIEVLQGTPACLADCSYGYTLKIPMPHFDQVTVGINGEYFSVVYNDLSNAIGEVYYAPYNDDNKIQIIVNKRQNQISFSGIKGENVHYVIADLSGRMVQEGSTQNEIFSISSLQNGIYVLSVKNDSQVLYRGKFVKQ